MDLSAWKAMISCDVRGKMDQATTKEHYLTFVPPPRLITHIQKVVKQGGVFVDDQLLDLGGTDIKPGSKVKHDGSCS